MKIQFTKQLFMPLLFITISLFSCKDKDEKVEVGPMQSLNDKIYKMMVEQKYYYWYNDMTVIKPNGHTDGSEYLDAMLYKAKDRWSNLIDKKTMDSYYNEGKTYAFGITQKYNSDGVLKVSYVIKNSPMDKAGIKRGYQLLGINGYNIGYILNNNMWATVMGGNEQNYTADFQFKTTSGELIEVTVSKKEVIEEAVALHSIIEVEGVKTGYLLFQTFITPGIDQLNEAFASFKTNNIKNLIVDLRYNSGGSLDVALHMCNLIAGKGRTGRNLLNLQHNVYLSANNQNFKLKEEVNSIALNKILFITSKKSASASEAVINGLSPYMEVKLVGEDTYGKPVGMNTFPIDDYYLLPVTFSLSNSNSQGEYFDGIPVDASVSDDLSKELGNHKEECLQEALHYLKYGNFSTMAKSATVKTPLRLEEMGENLLRYVSGNFY